MISVYPVQLPGTAYCLIYMVSLTIIHSKYGSRVYLLIILSVTFVQHFWTLCKALQIYRFHIELELELALI